MDLTALLDYVSLVIVGICLCVGYILKNIVPSDTVNKFIPLIMGVIGLAINVWMMGALTPDVILGGLFSGLASTGLYEAFTNLIKKTDDKEDEQ